MSTVWPRHYPWAAYAVSTTALLALTVLRSLAHKAGMPPKQTGEALVCRAFPYGIGCEHTRMVHPGGTPQSATSKPASAAGLRLQLDLVPAHWIGVIAEIPWANQRNAVWCLPLFVARGRHQGDALAETQ